MAAQRILLVDDEPQILKALRLSISAAGYTVLTAATGAEAIETIRRELIDAVILDLGLPDMDGKEVIGIVRQWSEVPIVILSARHMEGEKIAALDAGASDYVNKPFGVGELLARIRVALRLQRQRDSANAVYRASDLSVDVSGRRVIVRGKDVRLTPKEFDLLRILIMHAGQVVTHNQLLSFVWGPNEMRDSQVLRVLVGQLRQKIEADPRVPAIVLTEPGVGYRLRAEDDPAEARS
ncbi:response regulator [Dongia deserti]|uniref:response regulator n=1 Tax=Dongia deserti TaxID=2268030 RepID=UPI000E6592F5|nr:response regulator transcription factor [Dongia deserti]